MINHADSKSCCTGSRNENYLEVDDDDSFEPAQEQFYETSEIKKDRS